MIIIADDTFKERYKFNDLSFLEEIQYKKICLIITQIKSSELNNLVSKALNCSLFCYHRSLQIFDNNYNSLNSNINEKLRTNLINQLNLKRVKSIVFSGSLTTNFELKQLDKNLFYFNIKDFLDFYIETGTVEIKILFLGKDFKQVEKISAIQKFYMAIRMYSLEDLMSKTEIMKELRILFNEKEIPSIINQWKKYKMSKQEIINFINTKLAE